MLLMKSNRTEAAALGTAFYPRRLQRQVDTAGSKTHRRCHVDPIDTPRQRVYPQGNMR